MTDVERGRDPATEKPAKRGLPALGPAEPDRGPSSAEPTAVPPGSANEPVEPALVSPVALRSNALGRAFATTATLSLRLLLVVAALVVVGYVIGKIFIIVFPIALALLLCTVLWPPVRFARRRGTPPVLAASGVLLIGFALLGGLVTLLAPQVASQTQDLADQVVQGLDDLQALLAKPPFNLDNDQVGGAVESLITQLQLNTQTIAGRVVSGVGVAGNIVVELVLALVLAFFFLKDGPTFLPWLNQLTGPRAARHVSEVAERSWSVLGAFIRAQSLVGLVDAVFIGVGLAILGVPLALPLAVLVFFGAFIPIVGAFVTGALAALVALVTGGVTDALIVVAIVLVVQQIEGNVLQPLLMSRALDLHPALVLLAVTVGGSLAGITGAFLAVPALSIAAVLVRYTRETLGDPETVPDDQGSRVASTRVPQPGPSTTAP